MSGREAADHLRAEAEREEFVAVDLLLRVLRVKRRTMMSDLKRKHVTVTYVGRQARVPAAAVLEHYLPRTSPAVDGK